MLTSFAGKIDVGMDTQTIWAQQPEFLSALQAARARWARWYEGRAREIALGGRGSARIIIYVTRNAAPADYPDKQSLEHSAKDPAPVERPNVSMTAVEAAAAYARFIQETGITWPLAE